MNLADELPEAAIATSVRVDDWRGAVRAAGERLVAAGVTTGAYTDEMLQAIDEHGPYIVIAPGFALAHARPSAAVLRTGISWVALAEPVAFGHAQNDPVRLVVGLAATDHDGHVAVLAAIAELLQDDAALADVLAAPSPSVLRDRLAAHATP